MESGIGRYDVMLIPCGTGKGIIFEIKKSTKDNLENIAIMALS